MDKEAFDIKERARGAKRRAEEKARRIVWRVEFRKKQGEALERAKILLETPGLKKTPHYFLCTVLKNRRGPRPDEIKRINFLWAKYKGDNERGG